MTERHDIYTSITNQIIAAIETGAGSWSMPWHHTGAPVMRPTSAAGRRYSGINRLVLWATADALGYGSGTWATYRQWGEHGGQVRKGERGTHVVLWKRIDRPGAEPSEPSDGAEAGSTRGRAFARAFVVFNHDQVDGLEPEGPIEVAPMDTSVADALDFFDRVGVAVKYGNYDAHYRPDLDTVFMPERSAFDSDLDLLSTLGHEICHASGHPSRLARETLRDYHKERAIRAREEIAVELAASFLMADLGLAYSPRPDHAAYVSSWLACLRHDPRAIFKAAAQAQAAADWVHAQAKASAAPLPLAA